MSPKKSLVDYITLNISVKITEKKHANISTNVAIKYLRNFFVKKKKRQIE